MEVLKSSESSERGEEQPNTRIQYSGSVDTADPKPSHDYEFAEFRIDSVHRELLRDGQPVPLPTRSFEALLLLVRQCGVLLDKTALMDAVWPDATVEENSLARAIADIRRALGEGPKEKRFIETVARRGYRFLPRVITRAANPERPGTAEVAAARPTRLAVVPFAWITAEGREPSLSIGMADAVITRLSNLTTLVVRPTSAILRYAAEHQDLAAIGRDLDVDFVISGNIQQSGDRLRVSVQMVSPDHQRSEWAEHFDEKSTHVFAVEDSISERIAEALALQLTSAQRESLTRRHTGNNEAYQLQLRGRYFLGRRTLAAAKKAIEHFEQALRLDEHYALAWAGIADAYIQMGLYGALTGWLPPHETYPVAKRAACKAIALEPRLAEAHASLGTVSLYYDWDWPTAQKEIGKALLLKPHYGEAHHWFAMMCCFLGGFEQALNSIETALNLEPFSLVLNADRGYISYFKRCYGEAIQHLQATLEMDDHFARTHHRLGLAYSACGLHREAIGHLREARKYSDDSPQVMGSLGYAYGCAGEIHEAEIILRELLALSANSYVPAAPIADVCAGLGRIDQTLEWLESAVSERSSAIVRLRVDPRFDFLRPDDRFQRIVNRVRTGFEPHVPRGSK